MFTSFTFPLDSPCIFTGTAISRFFLSCLHHCSIPVLPSSLSCTSTLPLFCTLLQVNISLKKPGSRLEHQGVKIEFVGQIELYYDRGNHHEFTSLVKELARPGELTHNTSFEFEFNQVEKPYESYSGTNVRLRQVTLSLLNS